MARLKKQVVKINHEQALAVLRDMALRCRGLRGEEYLFIEKEDSPSNLREQDDDMAEWIIRCEGGYQSYGHLRLTGNLWYGNSHVQIEMGDGRWRSEHVLGHSRDGDYSEIVTHVAAFVAMLRASDLGIKDAMNCVESLYSIKIAVPEPKQTTQEE